MPKHKVKWSIGFVYINEVKTWLVPIMVSIRRQIYIYFLISTKKIDNIFIQIDDPG